MLHNGWFSINKESVERGVTAYMSVYFMELVCQWSEHFLVKFKLLSSRNHMCMVFVQVLLEMWIQGSLNVDYVVIIIQEAAKKEISSPLSTYSFLKGMTFTSAKFLDILDNFLVVATVSHNKWNQHSLFWRDRVWCVFTTISSDRVVGCWMWEWIKYMAKQLYVTAIYGQLWRIKEGAPTGGKSSVTDCGVVTPALQSRHPGRTTNMWHHSHFSRWIMLYLVPQQRKCAHS